MDLGSGGWRVGRSGVGSYAVATLNRGLGFGLLVIMETEKRWRCDTREISHANSAIGIICCRLTE